MCGSACSEWAWHGQRDIQAEGAMSDRVDIYPVAIIEDRYSGVHSGGKWLAIAEADASWHGSAPESRAQFCIEAGPSSGNSDARKFWASPPDWIAVGNTPDEALAALCTK